MNICERAVVMSDTDMIDQSDLPSDVVPNHGSAPAAGLPLPPSGSLGEILAAVEQRVIETAMAEHGSQEKAAKALGVSQPTIARRIRKYGL